MKKLQELRQKLRNDGFLLVDYQTDTELLDAVENGIRSALQNYRTRGGESAAVIVSLDQEELGLLDLQEEAASELASAGKLMTQSQILLHDFNPELNAVSAQMSSDLALSQKKYVLDQAADLMAKLAKKLDINGEKLSSHFKNAETAILASLDFTQADLSEKVDPMEMREFSDMVQAYGDEVASTLESYKYLRTTILALPRLTANLNRGKASLVAAVLKNEQAIDDFVSLCKSVAKRASQVSGSG